MNLTVLLPVLAVKTWMIVMIVIIVVLIAAIVALGIYGKKLQTQQEESQKQLEAAKQTTKILVIDKKIVKMKDAGLPAMVMEQVNRMMRNQKVPIVKAKIGPQIMTFMCDQKVYDLIPIKKQVTVAISGIYIMEVKGARGGLEKAEPRKKKLGEKLRDKAAKTQEELNKQNAAKEKELAKKNKKKK